MDIVTIDFETYYDKEYSLSKMTTESYVRDSRFEVIGVGVKVNDGPVDFYSGSNVSGFLNSLDYTNKAILCHNTAFDGAILSWLFGIKPKLWLDTMSMARPYHGTTIGCSLKALAKHYGLPEKGDEVINAISKRRSDFTAQAMAAYADYCVNDIEITYKLFRKLRKLVPASELRLIDLTIRMFTEPRFELDRAVLETHLDSVQQAKAKLLNKLSPNGDHEKLKQVLMSNDIFADVLRKLGVDPPMKISQRTEKPAYAFAKTDKEFQALLEHSSTAVQNLAAARIGVKSTLEETRTESFLAIERRGPLPIMLNYWGAHTGRFSGGDKINLQNLPRKGALRRAMKAPKGYVVVASDLSQIEARMLAYVAEQNDLVQSFANGDDVYSVFASEVYGRKITKADEKERFLGKTAILGLGYSMSAAKFIESVRILSKGKITIDEETATNVVSVYRRKNHKVTKFWRLCEHALAQMALGNSGQMGPYLRYEKNRIYMPNGVPLVYHGLYASTSSFYYDTRKGRESIYGGKLTENIIQGLARQVIAEMMVKTSERYRPALQVHDEIVYLVPETEAAEAVEYIKTAMSTPPHWADGLPVSCEVGVGPSYGDAK